MKTKLILIFISFSFIVNSFCQNISNEKDTINYIELIEEIEFPQIESIPFGPCDIVRPEFSGGEKKLYSLAKKYFSKQSDFKITKDTICIVRLTIDSNSIVRKPIIEKSAGKKIDSLCLNFVKTLKNWKAGFEKSTNKKVDLTCNLPFKFKAN
ncbi:hypothetical protein [Wenyingzhuangia sp. IMCC45467]